MISTEQELLSLESKVGTIIVQQEKVLDFIDDQTQRDETPEEYVQQEIAKSLVREYGYPKKSIKVEFKLKIGSSRHNADLVIFPNDSQHVQKNAGLIVECKRQKMKPANKKEGVEQLQSYLSACPNAKFGLWTNGLERVCYRVLVRKGERKCEEIPDIPSYGKNEEDAERPHFDQLKPATNDALLFAFRRCHNYIASNQGLQKPQAFWELLKLIFCKIHDERHNEDVEFYAAAKKQDGAVGQMRIHERIESLWTEVKKRLRNDLQGG